MNNRKPRSPTCFLSVTAYATTNPKSLISTDSQCCDPIIFVTYISPHSPGQAALCIYLDTRQQSFPIALKKSSWACCIPGLGFTFFLLYAPWRPKSQNRCNCASDRERGRATKMSAARSREEKLCPCIHYKLLPRILNEVQNK